MNDKKIVNGQEVFLTDGEQAIRNAEIVAWESSAAEREAKKYLPDASQQVAVLINKLIDKGTISKSDMPDEVIKAVNEKLSQSGAKSIKVSGVRNLQS